MPLVNGKITELEMPSVKHARVLLDTSKRWRVRCLYGGRNGYKDWSAAAVCVETAVRVRRRFLFTREVQLTIADSAHQTLVDTINRLGYKDHFDVTNTKITCRTTGSTFIFRGLNDLVSEDIKSMEGIDVCVICEAQNLTEKSWNDLNPTIRKKGSEIWVIFNTRLETDFVYQLCVVRPHEDVICELVNYTDAPAWMCSQVIRDQAERDKVENFELYENKWLGKPLTIGLYFKNFGEHNRERPFIVPDQDGNGRIFGSLDHGIAHCTSFGLWWVDEEWYIHRVATYCANGGTTQSHAEAITEMIEGCRYTRCLYPCEVFYDYAMDTKTKRDERNYRSDLDEYEEVFSKRSGGRNTKFVRANKRKNDGCHLMAQAFDRGNGVPLVRYFDGLNDAFVTSVKQVLADKVNPEVYAKMDGDDTADEARYGIMGIWSKIVGEQKHKSSPDKSKLIPMRETLRSLFFSGKKAA